jgi:hypothetical protein
MKLEIPDYGEIKDLIRRGEQVAALDLVLKLRESCVTLREKLQAADERVHDLEKRLEERANLRHEPPVYYREGDPVPFCQVCWERDHKLSHLVVTASDSGGLYGDCKICEKHFVIRGSTNPRPGTRHVLSRREMLERAGL